MVRRWSAPPAHSEPSHLSWFARGGAGVLLGALLSGAACSDAAQGTSPPPAMTSGLPEAGAPGDAADAADASDADSGAQAGLRWPAGQYLPSFEEPAPVLDVMDVLRTKRFEGRDPLLSHATGSVESRAWRAIPGRDAGNLYMISGPSVTDVDEGQNRAHFSLQIDDNTTDDARVATVDVRDATTGTVLATQDVSRRAFDTTARAKTFSIDFQQTKGHALEFRVFWYGNATITCAWVGYENHAISDAQILFTSLKGVVNATRPRIYSVDDNVADLEGRHGWLDAMGLRYVDVADNWTLLEKYRTEVKGLVVYDEAQLDTLNLATTIAGQKDALVVPPSLVTRLTSAPWQFPVLADLRGQFTSKDAVYQHLYDTYWPQCTHRALIGLDPAGVKGALRDYAIAVRGCVVWLDPRTAKESSLLYRFLLDMPGGSAYLGWWPEEQSGVQAASLVGVTTSASDWSTNLTVYGGGPRTIRTKPTPAKPTLQNKIYVTLILSDGDNLQFLEHSLKTLWDTPERGKIPVGWTVNPALIDAAPGILNYLYDTATVNDALIAGPSGLGYVYPNGWGRQDDLGAWVAQTDDYMKRAGLRVVTVWNTVQGDVSPTVGAMYAEHAPSLLGMTTQKSEGGFTLYGKKLPAMGLSGNYCMRASDIKAALARGAARFNDSKPEFVSIQAVPWNLGLADLRAIVEGLDSRYVIVRPDTFFQLYREANQLPIDP